MIKPMVKRVSACFQPLALHQHLFQVQRKCWEEPGVHVQSLQAKDSNNQGISDHVGQPEVPHGAEAHTPAGQV